MVTGVVVMTQSDYIALGKQGQEYSRPGKVCQVKVRNNQAIVPRCIWSSTFQMEYRRTAKGRPATNRRGYGNPQCLTVSSGFVSFLQNSLFPIVKTPSPRQIPWRHRKGYILLPAAEGSLSWPPRLRVDCAYFLKSISSASFSLATFLDILHSNFSIGRMLNSVGLENLLEVSTCVPCNDNCFLTYFFNLSKLNRRHHYIKAIFKMHRSIPSARV